MLDPGLASNLPLIEVLDAVLAKQLTGMIRARLPFSTVVAFETETGRCWHDRQTRSRLEVGPTECVWADAAQTR